MAHKTEASEITIAVISRFWEKTAGTKEGCLLWLGFSQIVGGKPQPRFSISGHRRSPRIIAFFIKHRELPTKHFLRPSCGNNLCVSPDHIKETDRIDEALDSPNHKPLAKGYDERRKVW